MVETVVMVRHPSPMVLRVKRRRKARFCYAATHTPVVLRTGSADDLGETYTVRAWNGDFVWQVMEGALWYRVSGMSLRGLTPGDRGFPGVAGFEDFLVGAPLALDRYAHTDLDGVARRTPLAAVAHDAPGSTRGIDMDGRAGSPDAIEVAEILHDGRGWAAERLVRFMGERIRVVGDAVLVRAYDPLVTVGGAGLVIQPFPQARDTSPRAARLREHLGYRPDACEAGFAWQDRGARGRRLPAIGGWAGSLAGAPYGSDTARLVAGLAVTAAVGAFLHLEDGRDTRDRGSAGASVGPAAEALGLTLRAGVGGIAPEGMDHAVDVARRLILAVADHRKSAGRGMAMLREAQYLIQRFDEVERPLIAEGEPTAEDLAALGSLAV